MSYTHACLVRYTLVMSHVMCARQACLRRRYVLAAGLAAAATLFRQTNVVWTVFTLGVHLTVLPGQSHCLKCSMPNHYVVLFSCLDRRWLARGTRWVVVQVAVMQECGVGSSPGGSLVNDVTMLIRRMSQVQCLQARLQARCAALLFQAGQGRLGVAATGCAPSRAIDRQTQHSASRCHVLQMWADHYARSPERRRRNLLMIV